MKCRLCYILNRLFIREETHPCYLLMLVLSSVYLFNNNIFNKSIISQTGKQLKQSVKVLHNFFMLFFLLPRYKIDNFHSFYIHHKNRKFC